MSVIVEVDRLSKKYGQFVALNGLTFTVPRGEIIGLIGPNGAGKTSLLKILSGLMTATSGRVSICGINLAEHQDLAKGKVSLMSEMNPLPEHMRVGEYLRFRAALKGIRDVRLAVEKVMRRCDIYYDARYRMIKNLSKGYRQRVGIADAMLGNGELIILDEPTIGLDPRQIVFVRETLLELRGERTLLISSHILSELESICGYFIIINGGEIIATGSLADIYKLNSSANTMCIDFISGGISDGIIGKFLSENHSTKLSLTVGKNPNSSHLEFSISDSVTAKIVASAANYFGENLLSVGRKPCSLEKIFLSATKRFRD
jgi:ABC-2 type transport system ATP-binding protein